MFPEQLIRKFLEHYSRDFVDLKLIIIVVNFVILRTIVILEYMRIEISDTVNILKVEILNLAGIRILA